MTAAAVFTAVGGVGWCITHQGISDECGEDRNGHCDMADTCQHCHGDGIIESDNSDFECGPCGGTGRETCDIRTLYVEGPQS